MPTGTTTGLSSMRIGPILTTSGTTMVALLSVSRKFLHFSPVRFWAVSGEFSFVSFPFHPPSILPISLSGSDNAMYLLFSIDFVFHQIILSIFFVLGKSVVMGVVLLCVVF